MRRPRDAAELRARDRDDLRLAPLGVDDGVADGLEGGHDKHLVAEARARRIAAAAGGAGGGGAASEKGVLSTLLRAPASLQHRMCLHGLPSHQQKASPPSSNAPAQEEVDEHAAADLRLPRVHLGAQVPEERVADRRGGRERAP